VTPEEILIHADRVRVRTMADTLAHVAAERGATIAKLGRRIHWQRKRARRLREALREETRVRELLAQLLTETARALKGAPPEHVLHDWSDVPMRAALLVTEVTTLRKGVRTMLTPERTKELVGEMRTIAAKWVTRYAKVHAPHVTEADLAPIVAALGTISVEEATTTIDALERETMKEARA
jgi:altronate dehydratase